jgi:hypothetical protein
MTKLEHVRWIAGGTGAGKSTVTMILAERFDVTVYHGDVATHDWITRCTPDRHLHLHALATLTDEQKAVMTPEEKFAGMASLHGETIGFMVEDLLALPADRIILVDDFGLTPRDVAPLLSRPEQVAFLLPTPEFRRRALTARYADPDRARANFGIVDLAEALANRLGRDTLWDTEVARQAAEYDLPVIHIDGHRTPDEVADDLARRFRLQWHSHHANTPM